MNIGQTAIRLSRQEIAHRARSHTRVSLRLAWLMTVAFLLTLFVPPTVQLAYALGPGRIDAGAVTNASVTEIIRTLPSVVEAYRRADVGPGAGILAANRQLLRTIADYEKQLEERSLLSRRLLGPTQECLIRIGRVGNEQSYV